MEIDSSDAASAHDEHTDDTAPVEEDAPDISPEHPSLMSLRWLQRHWLPLGYHKNQVNTAVGIRFAAPWVASHLFFPTGRILCTGANNRAVDAALLRHGSTAYLRAAGLRTLRVQRRVCQNLVANCHLPAPNGLCLSLLCARHRGHIAKTRKFTGVKVRHEGMPGVTQLAFRKGRVVSIGAKRPEQVAHAYAFMAPIYRQCYSTPANVQLEEQLIAARAIERIGAAPPTVATAAPPAAPNGNPALSRGARRKHQPRVLGACV
jgi:TATA-box binding protein (TBP) (component of TFIID and TFIIIB)